MTRLGRGIEISEIQYFDIQRRVVAHETTEGWQAAPHVGGTYEPDITEFQVAFKAFIEQRIRDNPNALKITLNTILLYIIAQGIKDCPLY